MLSLCPSLSPHPTLSQKETFCNGEFILAIIWILIYSCMHRRYSSISKSFFLSTVCFNSFHLLHIHIQLNLFEWPVLHTGFEFLVILVLLSTKTSMLTLRRETSKGSLVFWLQYKPGDIELLLMFIKLCSVVPGISIHTFFLTCSEQCFCSSAILILFLLRIAYPYIDK